MNTSNPGIKMSALKMNRFICTLSRIITFVLFVFVSIFLDN